MSTDTTIPTTESGAEPVRILVPTELDPCPTGSGATLVYLLPCGDASGRLTVAEYCAAGYYNPAAGNEGADPCANVVSVPTTAPAMTPELPHTGTGSTVALVGGGFLLVGLVASLVSRRRLARRLREAPGEPW